MQPRNAKPALAGIPGPLSDHCGVWFFPYVKQV